MLTQEWGGSMFASTNADVAPPGVRNPRMWAQSQRQAREIMHESAKSRDLPPPKLVRAPTRLLTRRGIDKCTTPGTPDPSAERMSAASAVRVAGACARRGLTRRLCASRISQKRNAVL
jgi:hypothetical protein